jgi:hypothetical protein
MPAIDFVALNVCSQSASRQSEHAVLQLLALVNPNRGLEVGINIDYAKVVYDPLKILSPEAIADHWKQVNGLPLEPVVRFGV